MIASAEDKSIRIRFPKDVWRRVKLGARRNGRSFNSEVLVQLAQAYPGAKRAMR